MLRSDNSYRLFRYTMYGERTPSAGAPATSFYYPFGGIACARRLASGVIKWLSRPGVDRRVGRAGVSRSGRPIKPRAVFAASVVLRSRSLPPAPPSLRSCFLPSFPVSACFPWTRRISLVPPDRIAPIRKRPKTPAWLTPGESRESDPIEAD